MKTLTPTVFVRKSDAKFLSYGATEAELPMLRLESLKEVGGLADKAESDRIQIYSLIWKYLSLASSNLIKRLLE